jgi:simple sugar transport system substrate-binding protein
MAHADQHYIGIFIMKTFSIPQKALVMAASAVCLLTSYAQTSAPDIVTVVKLTGIGWFNRMEQGVNQFMTLPSANGRKTAQTGPAKADSVQQVAMLQAAIDQGAKAVAVVPLDPPALEATFKAAIAKGVKVVTHEAESQRYTHVNLEAFQNTEYGARLNERLAKCMGGEGKWTVFVGTISSQSHVQWADGGIDNARKLHPKMQLVDPKTESINDAQRAYIKAKEILRKYPDIRGFQGGSSADVLGIGRAVQEAGLQNQTCVFGTGLPSEAASLLLTGAIDGVALWDPKDAGLVMNRIAAMLIDGKAITDGADLEVTGYRKVRVRKGPGVGINVTGEAYVDIDKSNYLQYTF